ncbi:putative serine/threonine-protein kinase [Aphelenchoides besseyi]|nr:putative serine/threonine-protein kinase [Aphelenchoides besseyi]
MDVQKNELRSTVVVSSSSESEPDSVSEELADKSTLERILGKPSSDKEADLRRKLLERKSQLTEAKLRKKLLAKRTPAGDIRTKADFQDEHLANIPLPPESDDTSMEVDVELKNFEDLTDEEKPMLSPTLLEMKEADYQRRLCARLPIFYPGISGCRSIEEFKILNKIEEGTFGVVYRAVEERTDEVVALKRLKMEKEKDGFPITSLREINMLMKCRNHPNVVGLKEIVIGSTMDKIYLVMEFVEHDMKSLMKQLFERKKEVYNATSQVVDASVTIRLCLSSSRVIHRDLKSSNLLLSHNNVLKIADFGLAREYGEPLKAYTPVVVTLWYRSPELLLGTKKYSTAIDIWSIGCIFGEFLKLIPIFQGNSETDQLNKIFMDIGTPNETVWPGYKELPGVARCVFANTPYNQLRKKFMVDLKSELGLELMNRFLAPCPERRISAESALKHPFFDEEPKAAALDSFPTFPAKSENKTLPLRQHY